ncbi:MAG: ATP-binding protein [Adhaeribacter sp.]
MQEKLVPPTIFASSLFTSLLEHPVDLLLVTTPGGQCLYLDLRSRTLLGLGREQVWEENITDWVHPRDRPLLRAALQEALRQSRACCPPLRLLAAGDTWCWLSGEIVNLKHHQDLPGLALLLKQIPKPEKPQKPLPSPEQKLQQFSYLVSHHLRAPLVNAQGLVNLLTDPLPTEAFHQEILKKLKYSVWQLDAITKDINLILSNRNPSDPVAWEKVPFEQAFNQVMQNLSVPLQDCQGQVELLVNPGYSLHCPRAYLYSILYNLLGHVIKYRSPLRELRISLECRGSREDGTLISCQDNGLGKDLNTVESKPLRPDKKFHPGMPGQGIGLYLVKTHVDALGGKLQVLSTPEKGTRFLIHLPS